MTKISYHETLVISNFEPNASRLSNVFYLLFGLNSRDLVSAHLSSHTRTIRSKYVDTPLKHATAHNGGSSQESFYVFGIKQTPLNLIAYSQFRFQKIIERASAIFEANQKFLKMTTRRCKDLTTKHQRTFYSHLKK